MVSVCQICKEPIWNFFCPDCLAGDINKWLPSNMAEKFLKFHKQFSGYFHSNLDTTFNWCLSCKGLKESAICPYCYTNEVIYWLRARNPDMATKFAQLFPFDFEKIGHKSLLKTESLPVGEEASDKKQLGICDVCGEYSDELICAEGEWVCDGCKE
jgi:hypothetical protein